MRTANNSRHRQISSRSPEPPPLLVARCRTDTRTARVAEICTLLCRIAREGGRLHHEDLQFRAWIAGLANACLGWALPCPRGENTDDEGLPNSCRGGCAHAAGRRVAPRLWLRNDPPVGRRR